MPIRIDDGRDVAEALRAEKPSPADAAVVDREVPPRLNAVYLGPCAPAANPDGYVLFTRETCAAIAEGFQRGTIPWPPGLPPQVATLGFAVVDLRLFDPPRRAVILRALDVWRPARDVVIDGLRLVVHDNRALVEAGRRVLAASNRHHRRVARRRRRWADA